MYRKLIVFYDSLCLFCKIISNRVQQQNYYGHWTYLRFDVLIILIKSEKCTYLIYILFSLAHHSELSFALLADGAGMTYIPKFIKTLLIKYVCRKLVSLWDQYWKIYIEREYKKSIFHRNWFLVCFTVIL